MIDIHTHILPGVDDGAASWEESMDMARMALESGSRILCATSHSNLPGRQSLEDLKEHLKTYTKRLRIFRAMLEKEKIGIQILSGMEIFASMEFIEYLEAGYLLPLGNTSYVLIEFPLNSLAFPIYRIAGGLLDMGYIPVIAHPERYLCVQNTIEHIYEWQQMGVVIQLNKGSLFGRFGTAAKETADRILRHRLAAVVASDAHSAMFRTTNLSQAWDYLASHYGPTCPEILLEKNPSRILDNRAVTWQDPIPFHKLPGRQEDYT